MPVKIWILYHSNGAGRVGKQIVCHASQYYPGYEKEITSNAGQKTNEHEEQDKSKGKPEKAEKWETTFGWSSIPCYPSPQNPASNLQQPGKASLWHLPSIISRRWLSAHKIRSRTVFKEGNKQKDLVAEISKTKPLSAGQQCQACQELQYRSWLHIVSSPPAPGTQLME